SVIFRLRAANSRSTAVCTTREARRYDASVVWMLLSFGPLSFDFATRSRKSFDFMNALTSSLKLEFVTCSVDADCPSRAGNVDVAGSVTELGEPEVGGGGTAPASNPRGKRRRGRGVIRRMVPAPPVRQVFGRRPPGARFRRSVSTAPAGSRAADSAAPGGRSR